MGQLDQYDQQVNIQYSARPGTVNFPLPPPSRASRAASQYRRATIQIAGRKSMFFDPQAPPLARQSQDGEESMPRTAVDMGDLDKETADGSLRTRMIPTSSLSSNASGTINAA
jgi:hypothetical protein